MRDKKLCTAQVEPSAPTAGVAATERAFCDRPHSELIGHLCLSPLEFCLWRLTKPAADAEALRHLEQSLCRGSSEHIYF